MRIGMNGSAYARDLPTIRKQASRAAKEGCPVYWLSQFLGPDLLTSLAVVGAENPEIELGASVVPIYGRHPIALAIQAMSVQSATNGRLVLGIGVSHRVIVEGMYGLPFEAPFSYLKEYLAALKPLLRGEPTSFRGERISANAQLTIDAPPPPILLAALGERSLELAGSEADGTITYLVGPKTLKGFVVPTIRRAAEAAGRPEPRIAAGYAICVTDDRERARRHAAERLTFYRQLPAYRAAMDREGVDQPEDVVLVGNESEIRERLETIADAGATDLRGLDLSPTPEDAERTFVFLASLSKERKAGVRSGSAR